MPRRSRPDAGSVGGLTSKSLAREAHKIAPRLTPGALIFCWTFHPDGLSPSNWSRAPAAVSLFGLWVSDLFPALTFKPALFSGTPYCDDPDRRNQREYGSEQDRL
jgi:hypothetical protein